MAKTRSAPGSGPSQRQLRVGELIRRRLSEVLDPRRHPRPRPERDLDHGGRSARLARPQGRHHLCPALGRQRCAEAALDALRRNKGEIRRAVAKGLDLKFAPELRFALDDTFDRMDETRQALLARQCAPRCGKRARPGPRGLCLALAAIRGRRGRLVRTTDVPSKASPLHRLRGRSRRSEALRLWHATPDGEIFGSFDPDRRPPWPRSGEKLGFAMNGGMYHDDRAPGWPLRRRAGAEKTRLVTQPWPREFRPPAQRRLLHHRGPGSRVIETLAYAETNRRPAPSPASPARCW